MVDWQKAAIVGYGFVGAGIAFALMQDRIFSGLVLIDATLRQAADSLALAAVAGAKGVAARSAGELRPCLKLGDVSGGEGFLAAGKQVWPRNPGGFQGKLRHPGGGRPADWAC